MPYYGKLYMKDANGNVAQIVPEAYNPITQYVGATASANGTTGTVPPAQISQRSWFLGGDAEWHNVNFVDPVALSGTAIDLSVGNVFTKTISSSTTFTITGVPQGKSTMFNLVLTNGGSRTITWPASVKWTAGSPPTLTSSGIDVLTFLTIDGGITWYGTMAVQGAA
jgi:hypothetical protein